MEEKVILYVSHKCEGIKDCPGHSYGQRVVAYKLYNDRWRVDGKLYNSAGEVFGNPKANIYYRPYEPEIKNDD